ncbi:hypothetical protein [Nitrobacter vulgaris]|jgi:hypothetical protein|uniref:hypothetical protein n=1 Tax=Nitrobacter vulgaris TaxID=29421 RepID=UPI00286A9F4A|nr:hypothetical protein [Nitrobacter vulgaris]
MTNETEQQKNLSLDRGLFFINYKSADDSVSPPRVIVAPAQGHERRMEIILHPDATEPILYSPNSGLVVRINTPATLQVQVRPTRPGGSRSAIVRVEQIQAGRIPDAASSGNGVGLHVATEGLKVLGHVAGRGDIVVGPDAWIAGPAAPSRVEGVALEWPDKPASIDIRYAVQFANGQTGSGKMVPLGTYAGTRGRALPLTGVVLEMSGTDELKFVAEAGFLNAPTLRAVGKRVVLSGPTSREPLVGIRIGIERSAPAEVVATSAIPRKSAGSARVRVFRSQQRQAGAAR